MLALALTAGGCSGDLFGRSDAPTAPGAARSSSSLGERISGLFGGPPSPPEAEASAAPPRFREDFDCPTVVIRPGTSTFAISAPSVEASALAVRYQATFGQTARECRLTGTTLNIKVGVEGRVIVGPAGGPGQMEMPLRYAVVQEGPEPKTIVTKLRWISVVVPPGAMNVPFTQVEEELTFPMPRGRDIDAYVIYIGFDREAMKQPERKRPAQPQRAPKRGT